MVVSHSGFLRVGVTGFYYANADYRIFDFVDGAEGEGTELLKQWDGMEHGGMGKSWRHAVPLGDGLPDAQEALAGAKEGQEAGVAN